ncbi:VPLPA-CTERM sorting domain-containing protein [Paragemmobacter kunshanensis]|nr:VPLPA-CTERM sorting domain-containing protein [Rhodobacter kunshanensis]
MSSLSMLAKSAALAAVLAAPASAAVVVPDSGTTNYEFYWAGGLGPIDGIDGVGDPDWSLTLTSASDVSITARDGFILGDAFELLVGGAYVPWTTIGTTAQGYFQATYQASLAAGSYLFSLRLSALAPGFTTGGAFASFTVTPTVVPLPAAGLLLIGALGSLVALRRRKTA